MAARDLQRERQKRERAQIAGVSQTGPDLFNAPVKVTPSIEDTTSIEIRKTLGSFDHARPYLMDNHGTLQRRLLGVDTWNVPTPVSPAPKRKTLSTTTLPITFVNTAPINTFSTTSSEIGDLPRPQQIKTNVESNNLFTNINNSSSNNQGPEKNSSNIISNSALKSEVNNTIASFGASTTEKSSTQVQHTFKKPLERFDSRLELDRMIREMTDVSSPLSAIFPKDSPKKILPRRSSRSEDRAANEVMEGINNLKHNPSPVSITGMISSSSSSGSDSSDSDSESDSTASTASDSKNPVKPPPSTQSLTERENWSLSTFVCTRPPSPVPPPIEKEKPIQVVPEKPKADKDKSSKSHDRNKNDMIGKLFRPKKDKEEDSGSIGGVKNEEKSKKVRNSGGVLKTESKPEEKSKKVRNSGGVIKNDKNGSKTEEKSKKPQNSVAKNDKIGNSSEEKSKKNQGSTGVKNDKNGSKTEEKSKKPRNSVGKNEKIENASEEKSKKVRNTGGIIIIKNDKNGSKTEDKSKKVRNSVAKNDKTVNASEEKSKKNQSSTGVKNDKSTSKSEVKLKKNRGSSSISMPPPPPPLNTTSKEKQKNKIQPSPVQFIVQIPFNRLPKIPKLPKPVENPPIVSVVKKTVKKEETTKAPSQENETNPSSHKKSRKRSHTHTSSSSQKHSHSSSKKLKMKAETVVEIKNEVETEKIVACELASQSYAAIPTTPAKTPPEPPDSSLNPAHSSPTAALTQQPQYFSYFEKFDTQENLIMEPDYYLNEAKRLKHKADKEDGGVTQILTYMDATLHFILHGIVIEKFEKGLKEAFSMYKETLSLIRHIGGRPRKKIEDIQEIKLLVLNYRIQALLAFTLYKFRGRDTSESSLYLKEVYGRPPTPYEFIPPAPALTTHSPHTSLGTPSPHSPGLSPAGYVPISSGIGNVPSSQVTNTQSPHSQPPQTYAISRNLYQHLYRHYSLSFNLIRAHDLWADADAHVEQYHIQEFFISIDRSQGPITLHSSLLDLVRYVRCGLKIINQNLLESS